MRNIVRLFLTAFVTLALACGGSGTPPPDIPDHDDQPQGPVKTDVVFEYPAVSLSSTFWSPKALGTPAMWNINIPKKASLKKQRKLAARKKASEADLQLLAALLWRQSDAKAKKAKSEKDEAKRTALLDSVTALRTEARDALRRGNKTAGEGKASEITLKLLSVAEMTLADYAAAEAVYKELVDRFPAPGASSAEIWLAGIYLQANRNADAAKMVEGWTLDDKMHHRGAYVVAWSAFRKRDYEVSNDAIAFAMKNWKGAGKRDLLDEYILISATGRAPVAATADLLGTIVDNPSRPDSKFKWIRELAKAYEFSGHTDLASELLGDLVAGKYRDPLPFPFRALYRADRAFQEVKNGRPGEAAKLAIAAHKMIAECADACTDANKARLTGDLQTYGTLFHTQYALSFDERYYAPAKALYDHYLAGDPNHEQMRKWSTQLAEQRANPTPKDGKHKQDELIKLISLRERTVSACYGAVLTSEPGLAGKIEVVAQLGDKGDIEGVTTTPAKGLEGLAAVGACLNERVRRWKFPGRTVAGTTALKMTFELSVGPDKK